MAITEPLCYCHVTYKSLAARERTADQMQKHYYTLYQESRDLDGYRSRRLSVLRTSVKLAFLLARLVVCCTVVRRRCRITSIPSAVIKSGLEWIIIRLKTSKNLQFDGCKGDMSPDVRLLDLPKTVELQVAFNSVSSV
jgi:hypothetical protein